MKKYPVGRNQNVIEQNSGSEVLLYDTVNNKAYCLNRISALIWQNCDGRRTVAELAEILGREFKSAPSEDLVWLVLDKLGRDGLLQEKAPLPAQLGRAGETRDHQKDRAGDADCAAGDLEHRRAAGRACAVGLHVSFRRICRVSNGRQLFDWLLP